MEKRTSHCQVINLDKMGVNNQRNQVTTLKVISKI